MAGRGFGKTRISAEYIREKQEKQYMRTALVVLVTDVKAERRVSLERLDGLIAAHYPWAVGEIGLPRVTCPLRLPAWHRQRWSLRPRNAARNC